MTNADRDDYNERVGRQVDDFRRSSTRTTSSSATTRRSGEKCGRTASIRKPGSDSPTGNGNAPHEHFADYLFGLPHVQTQLHYPVLEGLGLLDAKLAKSEMARQPEVRAFARKTVDSLVKEYKLAATKALGHAEFLEHVRNNAE